MWTTVVSIWCFFWKRSSIFFVLAFGSLVYYTWLPTEPSESVRWEVVLFLHFFGRLGGGVGSAKKNLPDGRWCWFCNFFFACWEVVLVLQIFWPSLPLMHHLNETVVGSLLEDAILNLKFRSLILRYRVPALSQRNQILLSYCHVAKRRRVVVGTVAFCIACIPPEFFFRYYKFQNSD
jgi:hypothetical protein